MQNTAFDQTTIQNETSPAVCVSLPPTGNSLVLQGQAWLPAIMAIHRQARHDEPLFLMPKTETDFSAFLNSDQGLMLGVFSENTLVGIAALKLAPSLKDALATKSLTCPASFVAAHNTATGPIGIVQSVAILPGFAKRGFSHALLRGALSAAHDNDLSHLFAQVATANKIGVNIFTRQGFTAVGSWVNGHERTLLQLKVED